MAKQSITDLPPPMILPLQTSPTFPLPRLPPRPTSAGTQMKIQIRKLHMAPPPITAQPLL